MARTNKAGELWNDFTEFGRMIDSTAASTAMVVSTGGGSSAGGTSITVNLSTLLSTGEYLRTGPVGGAQVFKIEAISTGGAITLVSGAAEAISSGDPVRPLSRVALGCPDDNGVQFENPVDITTVNSACQRNAYAHLIAHTDMQGSVGLLNISFENLLATVGSPEADLLGAGTVADPTVAYWLPDTFDTVKPIHFYARGTKKDGTAVEVQFWDCDVDPTKSMALTRGQEVPLGLAWFHRITAWYEPVA